MNPFGNADMMDSLLVVKEKTSLSDSRARLLTIDKVDEDEDGRKEQPCATLPST